MVQRHVVIRPIVEDELHHRSGRTSSSPALATGCATLNNTFAAAPRSPAGMFSMIARADRSFRPTRSTRPRSRHLRLCSSGGIPDADVDLDLVAVRLHAREPLLARGRGNRSRTRRGLDRRNESRRDTGLTQCPENDRATERDVGKAGKVQEPVHGNGGCESLEILTSDGCSTGSTGAASGY